MKDSTATIRSRGAARPRSAHARRRRMLAACSPPELGSAPSAGIGLVRVEQRTAAAACKTGLKVFVIPKNLGNPYFTTSDSVQVRRGAGRAGGSSARPAPRPAAPRRPPASQIPAIQAAITKGANVLIVSGHRPDGAVPDAEGGHGQGHQGRHVDSDAPDLPRPVRQPGLDRAIGTSEVDLLAKQIRRHRRDRDPVGRGHRRPTRTPGSRS